MRLSDVETKTINNFSKGRLIDDNEAFAILKCCEYLKAHNRMRPVYDRETLTMLVWVLNDDIRELVRYFVANTKANTKRKLDLYLDSPYIDFNECVNELATIIRSQDRVFIQKLQSTIADLLKTKIETSHYKGSSLIEKKINAFRKLFNLSDDDVEFVTFTLIVSLWVQAEDFFVDHLHCNHFSNKKCLSNLLKLRNGGLEKVLGGTLSRIQFFDLDKHSLCVKPEFMDFFQNTSEKAVSRNFYITMPLKTIPLNMHMVDPEETSHVLALLGEKTATSTHILLYGSPGTGKTSYAAGLIKKLGLTGYEIVKNDENASQFRRAAIVACCSMTKDAEDSVIVVDEADNILNTHSSWMVRGETQDKGWLNQMLEEKGFRMIWITNSIDAIEESVKRRFAYSVHFRPFNRRQRIQLWESILRKNRIKKLFGQSEIIQLARDYEVSAGIIDLAVRKTLETYPSKEYPRYKNAITRSLDAHLTLANEGHKPVHTDGIEENYSLDGLNIRGDLNAIMVQLEEFDHYLRQNNKSKRMNMNILFYGPPGTGKSELAKYISHRLDRDLLCKRASDIMNPYVGMTEKLIRDAFDQAETEEAILVIDEADSLIFSRDRAVRSWEVSFTNEFLTQMERFNGILICTTNRLKDLDSASIRRFNHKIEFRYLTTQGSMIFYNLFLAPLAGVGPDENIKSALSKMTTLAPGDFKAVRDRFLFGNKDISHDTLTLALQDECRAKEMYLPSRTTIGFNSSEKGV